MKRVKVVAEEAGGFLDWQVLPDYYNHNEEVFPRLKKKKWALVSKKSYGSLCVDCMRQFNRARSV
ncbi:hypothetical protein FRE64_00520 [Euhalothece natronophila Z-M001]|uniref:Uncharacterized protein n=1 Tax=Euhalothece natronophila Z-M001 TaxID=522448 RepID=A0A5B8NJ91_9CHRO|nr:glucosylglycerol hydrolase [Euhalothece natronophila]QDZ38561.1 hypothetical protein FRE64_00520 [Euhalothece natronophila Z-M001]